MVKVRKTMDRIISRIRNSEHFIYKIKNTYYYLGSTICRECSNEEIEIFNELIKEFENLKGIKYPIEAQDCKKFNEYFDQVISIPVEEYTHQKNCETVKQMKTMLERLSEEEISDILLQYNDRDLMLTYRKGKYYIL